MPIVDDGAHDEANAERLLGVSWLGIDAVHGLVRGGGAVPMPRWWTHINKRVFNPVELRRGARPALTHVGRSSGTPHRTPLDAHPVTDGFVFILVYGSASDWVRNVLASGRARLTVNDEEFELVAPRLVSGEEAWAAIGPDVKRPPGWLRIDEYLRMDIADGGDVHATGSE